MKLTNIFNLFFTVLLLSLSIYLYAVYTKENTYCLWNGAWLDAINETGDIIKHASCYSGDCNEMMCNMLWSPGTIKLSVMMLHPTSEQLHYTYIDVIWFMLFAIIIISIVINIIDICISGSQNKIFDYVNYDFNND